MNRVLFSRKSDHWATPKAAYDALDAEFDFDLDPCPLRGSGGLQMDWNGSVFINPPYSNIRAFIEKGLHELRQGRATKLVYLLPARTGTSWFHDYCLSAQEIRFMRGRLKFGESKTSAPFDSMVVIWAGKL